jgi:hypothetical protein
MHTTVIRRATQSGAMNTIRPVLSDPANDLSALRYPDATVWELLFLYLWPTAIFEDASTGTCEEQWAKYQRNRKKRVYLPHYGRVWLLFSGFFLAARQALGQNFPFDATAQIATDAMLTAFACSLTVVIVIAFAYVWFTRNE